MSDDTGGEAVGIALRTLNDAWLNGRFDELPALVQQDMVAVAPGFGERSRGGEAFVAGLRDFMQSATIRDFTEHDLDVDVIGDTAIASYRFEMDYERSGRRYAATGRDLYVFRRLEERWIAVWRTLLEVDERPA